MESEDLDSGFVSFFKNLPIISGNHIRLFERDQAYFVYGKDALFVADSFYKTSTVLKYFKNLTYCSISKLNAHQLIRDLLLLHGYCVEIWGLENKKWCIEKQASPGNVKNVEDLLFTQSDMASTPVVVAVSMEKGNVGVCFTDASTSRVLGISEFIDNEVFSNLESLLIQQNIKECVLPDDSSFEMNQIRKVVKRVGVVCTDVSKQKFNAKNIVQDLNRLLDNDINAQGLAEVELKAAMASTACIISYLELLQDESNLGSYQLEKVDLSQYMRLDASAVLALNLNPGPKDGNKNMNLFGLLNRCKTAQGSRLLGQWIKQPLMNVDDIEQRQNLVQLFAEDVAVRQTLQETSLKSFPDLHRLAKKFQRGKSNLQDVVRVYQVIRSLPLLLETLDGYSGEFQALLQNHFIEKFKEYNQDLMKLLELVESTIDMQALDNHEYRIKPDFDPNLQEIQQKLDDISSRLKPEAQRVAAKLDVEFEKKLKFEHNPQYGHHLRLSRADANKIRGDKDYIELRTQKAGVLFTTTVLRRLSSDYTDLGKEYQKVSSGIAKQILTITGTYFPALEQLNRLVAELDVFISLAQVAVSAPIPFVRPKVSNEGDLVLKGARHPCVEMQEDVSFIENDISMVNDSSMFHIITGPNMGGKSTYIRQVGVITLMAQMGSFVPCQEAQIRVVDAILARVGAGDCQLKGISTFMAEMLETAAILRTATVRSLIIIDELGRGTSTKDGFGLAWAIADYIARNIKCFTLFATHFHEITKLSDLIPTVQNFHVQAHLTDGEQKSFTLLYKVCPSSCDQSFGIHVAELAQFPSIVVQIAKRKAAELEGFEKANFKKWKSQDAIQSGSEIITKFLEEYGNIKGDCKSGLDVLLSKYQSDFEANPFIQEVLYEF